jgi:regulatory protein
VDRRTVTAIEPVKRPRGYRAVYVDGELVVTSHPDSLAAVGLRPGKEFDADALAGAVAGAQEADALRQALESLAGRDRTETELRRALSRRRFPQPIIDTVLERLRSKGLIDDRRYAREYVRIQGAGRGWGPAALRGKLEQVGMAPSPVEEALAEELPAEDQEAVALRIARRWLGRRSGEDARRTRPRLYAFILRRGFDEELAARTMHRLLGDSDEE